ncbi:MAG: hypothetical protein MUP58_00290 [Candidatus Nanohaloarchaeota archaeon QJJ-9]|nr:hypothetical protein [Candidatus Nanohaloarchaeota archaeon QJJ-9]
MEKIEKDQIKKAKEKMENSPGEFFTKKYAETLEKRGYNTHLGDIKKAAEYVKQYYFPHYIHKTLLELQKEPTGADSSFVELLNKMEKDREPRNLDLTENNLRKDVKQLLGTHLSLALRPVQEKYQKDIDYNLTKTVDDIYNFHLTNFYEKEVEDYLDKHWEEIEEHYQEKILGYWQRTVR